VFEFLARKIRQKKEIKRIQIVKEELVFHFCKYDPIFEDPEESIRKLLDLINTCSFSIYY
jgi:hypothetical protein